MSRPSFRFNYDSEYATVPYHSIKRVIPIVSEMQALIKFHIMDKLL